MNIGKRIFALFKLLGKVMRVGFLRLIRFMYALSTEYGGSIWLDDLRIDSSKNTISTLATL